MEEAQKHNTNVSKSLDLIYKALVHYLLIIK